MNLNNFTIKSQEAIQQAQQLAQGFGHQQIENEHIFKAIFEVDENVLPFILKKNFIMRSRQSRNKWQYLTEEHCVSRICRVNDKALNRIRS